MYPQAIWQTCPNTVEICIKAPLLVTHIHWSLARKLSSEKSPLLTWQIWGLLFNTLAANEKYPFLNKENFKIPIKIQLSEKEKKLSEFFATFWKFFVFPKLRTLKTWLDECLKSLVSAESSTGNIVNVPKHCWNLHHTTLIILIDHCQGNGFQKSLSYKHAKSWDCLLTYCLLTKSILFLIETI